jgi:hypothetical protein
MWLLLPAARSQTFQSITLPHTSTISRVIKTLADKHNSAGHDDSTFAWTANLQQFPCLITHDVAKTGVGRVTARSWLSPHVAKYVTITINLITFCTKPCKSKINYLQNKKHIYIRYSLLHASAVDHQHRGVAPTAYPVKNTMKPLFTEVYKLKSCNTVTGMHRVTTLRSTMDRIYDGGPIKL